MMFHNNIVKFSEALNKQKMLKICVQFTYRTNFCTIYSHFLYYGKKCKCLIFHTNDENKTFRAQVVKENGHDKTLHIYSLYKR